MKEKVKKILIYDTSLLFFNYLKKVFPMYKFVSYNQNQTSKVSLRTFSAVVFVMEDQVDIIEFLLLCDTNIPLILCPYNRNIFNRRRELEHLYDIFVIDMAGTKYDVKDQLAVLLEQIIEKHAHNDRIQAKQD